MEEDGTGISVACSNLSCPQKSAAHQCSTHRSSAPSLPALIFEPSFSSSSSSSTSVPALANSNSALVKMERMMDEPLTRNLGKESCLYQLHQQRNESTPSEDGGGSTERWGFSDEWFSVDDILNLGDDVENDKEAEARDPYEEECIERGDSLSNSASSGLSYQPPSPPPPPETSLSDINVPAHDAEELEWVSFIIDDSHAVFTHDSSAGKFPQPPAPYVLKQTVNLAAVAVDSGRPVEALGPVKAKRSKRARSSVLSTAWLMSCSFLLASSVSSTTNTTSCSSCNTSDSCLIYDPRPAAGSHESLLLYDVPPQRPRPTLKQAPNKRGRKPKHPAADASGRRCSHCGAQKTPQWRAGPLGAKTLCNACGVRFKSGRLLPEYRPACSPTFISHVHSNSHRKVLEMRRKKEAELVVLAGMTLIGS